MLPVLSQLEWMLIAGIVVSLVFSLVAFFQVRAVREQSRALFADADGRGALELLNRCIEKVATVQHENNDIKQSLDEAHRMLTTRVVRPLLKRYNSFEDVGGNQSFSLLLLDPTHSGVIISSLHSRQGAIMYAKWIADGTPLHNLSHEEAEILAEALKANRVSSETQ